MCESIKSKTTPTGEVPAYVAVTLSTVVPSPQLTRAVVLTAKAAGLGMNSGSVNIATTVLPGSAWPAMPDIGAGWVINVGA